MGRRFGIDIPLAIVAVLLALTITGFLAGHIPYPFGFIVLFALLVGRVLYLRSK